jgi:co-chaperonin GroES (HSP10)
MLQPKFGRVLIEREVKEKTSGGIILPDSQKERQAPCVGTIKALGETAGWVEVPESGFVQTMQVGDKVIFGKHAGVWLDATYGASGAMDDGKLFMCQDADILAVMKEEK